MPYMEETCKMELKITYVKLTSLATSAHLFCLMWVGITASVPFNQVKMA